MGVVETPQMYLVDLVEEEQVMRLQFLQEQQTLEEVEEGISQLLLAVQVVPVSLQSDILSYNK